MLTTLPIYAEGNIHYGRLNVKPKLETELIHYSNIFLDDVDEVEDTVFTIQPSIMLEYKDNTPGNYFQTGYDLKLASYFKRNDNNYQTHEPYLKCGLRTPTGFIARFSERFMRTADPLGSATHYGEGRRTARSENTIDFTFGQYFTDRFSFETMYQNFAIRYRDGRRSDNDRGDQWQDRTDNIFSLKALMLITGSRKTSVLAEYRFTDSSYDRQNPESNSQDHNINTFLTGFRFEPGSKLSGEAKLGFENKSFDNSVDEYNRPYEDNSTWVIETDIKFEMSKITELGFKFIRSIEGAPDRDAASYVDTNIEFNLSHQIQHKVKFHTLLNWINSDYRDEKPGIPNKYLNYYALGFELEYKMRDWLKIESGYLYATKTASHSNFYKSEFTNNVLFFSSKAEF
jgi:hypothetical protein